MNNGAILCSKLRQLSGAGRLKSPFRFDDVLRIAKSAVNASAAGQQYAALWALQSCCTSTDPEFDRFKLGDPRRFNNIKSVKESWEFTLLEQEIFGAGERTGRSEAPKTPSLSAGKGLSDHDALALVKKTFKAICDCRDIEQVDRVILNEPSLLKNAMSELQYPEISFTLTKQEIEALRKSEVLDINDRLNVRDQQLTALEKLLYSLVWKNGDLGKERHIVRGVSSCDSASPNSGADGLVFFYYGRHLANRENPIIDQHVIRSFRLYELTKRSSPASPTRIRSMVTVDDDSIGRYAKWLASLNPLLTAQSGYRFHVDKVLFALGKAVKLRARQRKNQ